MPPVFRPLPVDPDFPALEGEVLGIWREGDTFRRQVAERPAERAYVFYDGPPFATGLPHYGHLVASTIKDVVPRYWAMRGYKVERRFGWDTHGLPIEMLVEKQLGLSGPASIREYGVAAFNEACRAAVLKYTDEWERSIGRLGRWVDFRDDYKTMDASFMESVWWVFGQLWDKGLIYQDFRVMPYSWRLSTSLSNFEAGLDYREVQDPALTVAMPSLDGAMAFLVWTTTPWTLPSNLAVAVGRDIAYVKARRAGDPMVYVVAEARCAAVLGADAEIVERVTGADLLGIRYAPLFPYFADRGPAAFFVLHADHVSTEDGTGIVHMAPDYGEEDFQACRREGIGVVQSVDDEGNFRASIDDFAGRNIKEADPDITKAIKASGRLFRHDSVTHSYPFCWRSGTPLIYRAVPAMFVKVSALRERMVAHNETIHWVPESVGSKRFGPWVADARDWNISRSRFWGTPIPVWRCARCEGEEVVRSMAELSASSGEEVTDLHPHRIDHLVLRCLACGGQSRRIAEVFDCWFESGSMPMAQDHYPFENKEKFDANFPAQFIAEGLDQTRGWFYTLLVLSTALFDRPPFENCVVNGMVLAEDGAKMSKNKQNYPPVDEVFATFGADALRAYLMSSPIVRAEPLRFSERGVREVVRNVLLPLWNSWSFFTQYANIDGWNPSWPTPPVAERPDLDRWILSVLTSLVDDVNEQMEGYYLDRVVPPVLGFIEDLTNWYIRRGRRRFWRAGAGADKAAAYATLYEVLTTFVKVLAPLLPFVTERMWQQLVVTPGFGGPDSVHLCDYPVANSAHVDRALEAEVARSRDVVRLGRALRETHKLKVRQPLRRVTVVMPGAADRAALQRQADIVAEELNVKRVEITDDESALAVPSFKANYKTLGKRFGKGMPAVAARVTELTAAEWAGLQRGETVSFEGQEIAADDVVVTFAPKGDLVIAAERGITVALDT
ncbi:MAG: isoleucine--tRNA ligase, partial [Deltaproteobacteria bacterium]|nr:isoleucine--tRNA ligase [Deltaproteobacteria bacterium]